LPDARKGERIVMLTTEKDASREALQQHIRISGGSELATPAEILAVNELPVLGTGKVDYVAATALAKELVGEERRVA
jgi:acyl-[acyl-carrier-protein]-phospholipid O-acyltransferase/long-chain-fatty-acid--[acyl-carrier-protein] ligase